MTSSAANRGWSLQRDSACPERKTNHHQYMKHEIDLRDVVESFTGIFALVDKQQTGRDNLGSFVLWLAAPDPNNYLIRKLERGDFYEILRSTPIHTIPNDIDVLAIVSSGWATPLDANVMSGTAGRQRVVVVSALDITTERTCCKIIFSGGREQIVTDEQPDGPLMEVQLAHAKCIRDRRKGTSH